ncbi:MAG: ATP-binding cassette domain-containing protein [Burkholderiales bacterium]|jgi:oligopeptide/dipeptide ABC transporter ATP-binding protein|nr:ATP-binding cassette domain-containing protein [Burkholderiales bacterium]
MTSTAIAPDATAGTPDATAGTPDGAARLAVLDVEVTFTAARSLADRIARRAPAAVRAVRGVSLDIGPGETVGLVGESGSGKTTLGRAIVQLATPAQGRILWRGRDVTAPDPDWQRRLRREVQMVFQDPYSSLNPRMTVAQTLAEVLRVHAVVPGPEVDAEVVRLLARVGLHPSLAHRHPRALSGGQRQRVGLARALAVRPALLVLDEPVAALDVSIQAQILNLLADLRASLGLAMLFVAHDLSVVRHVSDRIAVMYRGRVVEQGRADEVFEHPAHPYTRQLLASVPRVEPRGARVAPAGVRTGLDVAPPDSGCAYAPRCPLADTACGARTPRPVALSPTHSAACLRASPADS